MATGINMKELLDRQIIRKAIKEEFYYSCPVCGAEQPAMLDDQIWFCWECGQRMEKEDV